MSKKQTEKSAGLAKSFTSLEEVRKCCEELNAKENGIYTKPYEEGEHFCGMCDLYIASSLNAPVWIRAEHAGIFASLLNKGIIIAVDDVLSLVDYNDKRKIFKPKASTAYPVQANNVRMINPALNWHLDRNKYPQNCDVLRSRAQKKLVTVFTFEKIEPKALTIESLLDSLS